MVCHARRPPTWSSTVLFAGLLAFSLSFSGTRAEQNLTDSQVAILVQRLAEGATHSWEIGTRQQTLIELNTPSFSVLNTSFSLPPSTEAPDSLDVVLENIAEVVVNASKIADTSSPRAFFPNNGAAGDPVSVGVTAIIANWTGQSNDTVDYDAAIEAQMEYLWNNVPRTDDGAISHRVSQVQLWSDFVYMVPPFLSYYGVVKENISMVLEGYNQIKLYRQYLYDEDAGGLWKHVLFGSDFQDEGHWSTGNGWAAAGMLRVLGTIKNSQYANSLSNEIGDLTGWINEIHNAMYDHLRDDGMFTNYADDDSSFVDAASAALLAATVYRHALLTQNYHHLPNAETVRRALWSTSDSSSPDASVSSDSLEGMVHFDSNGWLTPVVNPNSFTVEGSQSPEAQAFSIQMYAAWKDWVDAGAVGANGVAPSVSKLSTRWTLGIASFASAITSGIFGGVEDD